MGLSELAMSGPLVLAALVAVAAGAVSFASPCCLPLVPGYLGYLAGLVGRDGYDGRDGTANHDHATGATTSATSDDVGESAARGQTATVVRASRRSARWRVVGATGLFVLGFTVVFSAGVLVVLGVSDLLLRNELLIQRIGGVVTIAMGLVFVGLVPALQREVRIHRKLPDAGLLGAPVLGAVFGLGWTPCLGPTLTGVIALATSTQVGGTLARGTLLVLAYCLGLGLPFLLLALGAQWAVRAQGWLRRHARAVQLAGGAMLIVVGALLVTGLWSAMINLLRGPISGFETVL